MAGRKLSSFPPLPGITTAGIESGHTLHLVKSRPPSAAGATSSPSGGMSSSAGASGGAGATFASVFGAGGGSGGLGGNGAGGLGGGAFGGSGGMNSDSMRAMMESPIMDSLFSNPEFMRSVLLANPATRRVMEENPEVARALQNPEALRTMAAAARNPQLMQEMMRNNDRQLANIESLPGGFDALRRMYETVQAPLEESLLGGGDGEGGAGATAPAGAHGGGIATAAGASMSAMPNPWARSGADSGGSPSKSSCERALLRAATPAASYEPVLFAL